MNFKILVINTLLLNSGFVISQEKTKDKITEPILSYTSDVGGNFCGGIKTGTALMGMINAEILLKSNPIWFGGKLYAECKNTHGILNQ